jgi:hypothetical protein
MASAYSQDLRDRVIDDQMADFPAWEGRWRASSEMATGSLTPVSAHGALGFGHRR